GDSGLRGPERPRSRAKCPDAQGAAAAAQGRTRPARGPQGRRRPQRRGRGQLQPRRSGHRRVCLRRSEPHRRGHGRTCLRRRWCRHRPVRACHRGRRRVRRHRHLRAGRSRPMSGRSAKSARRRPKLAAPAAAAVAEGTTRTVSAQTAEVFATRDQVTRCAQRYAACSLESRAGHVSEIMHAQSYNLDAIKRGSDLRARVTEWAPGGSQQAPADIEVIRGSLVEKPFQVKMNDKPPVLAREAARPTYRDMGLVLPSDRIDQVDRIYDAVSRRPPQSEGYADYAEARCRISDRVRHGGVESEPHTIGDAREVAKDPARWQRSQEVGAAYRDIGTAAAAGFLTAGALTFVIVGAQEASRWHHGEISSGQLAARAGRAAAAAGVRGGVVAGVGQTIGLAARSGHLPGLLGAGTVPYAVAGAALAV